MRIAFMGSPDFAVPCLAALLEAGHEIACVYSQPPKPSGRGQKLRQTPVHAFARARGIAVRTPKSLKRPAEQADFAALDLDAAAVVAYGLILPRPILEAPRFGCVNLHASLLPRWRGAAPIQRALMAGDRITGVQAMQMEEGLDTGPILVSREVPIEPDDTAGALHDRLAAAGAPVLAEALDLLARGQAAPQPQATEGVTYAHKINPEELRLDWSRPARELDLKIRGLSPFPGAWFLLTTAKGPVRVKALDSRLARGEGPPGQTLDDALLVACGEGALRLLVVQREGKGPMDAADFLRGSPIPPDTRLG